MQNGLTKQNQSQYEVVFIRSIIHSFIETVQNQKRQFIERLNSNSVITEAFLNKIGHNMRFYNAVYNTGEQRRTAIIG